MDSVGKWIRERRHAKGFSQRGLAELVGTSRAYIAQLERDYPTLHPDERLTRKLAVVLDDDPDELWAKVRTWWFLLRAGRGKVDNLDLIAFSSCAALTQTAKSSIRIRSFSGLPSLIIMRNELTKALQRDVAVQIILAQPTVENVYARALQSDLDVPGIGGEHQTRMNDFNYIVFYVHYHQLRFQTAIALLRTIWLDCKRANLELRLYDQYTPKQLFIFDNQVAIEQEPSREVVVTQSENDAQEYEKIGQRFRDEWSAAGPSLWSPRYRQRPILVPPEEIRKFLKNRPPA